MSKYSDCCTKEEVIKKFFGSKKDSSDYDQASERLSELGYQDDALKLHITGKQTHQIEVMAGLIKKLENLVNTNGAY